MTEASARSARPFCDGSKALRDAFDRWAGRLSALGVELEEPDRFVVGLLASREVRLEALGAELRRERDSGRRLRIVAAERLAAADMQKALDQAERAFGAAVAEDEVPARAKATGTDGGRVVPFVSASARGLGQHAQRIVAALAKAPRPMTKAQLRRAVPGGQSEFTRGLREAVDVRAVMRCGRGSKGRPYVYQRGDA
jgi:hypothetical protein